MTAVPTNMAVMHTGAKLVWADVNPGNGNIDWGDAISKITDKTVAIVCVHYAGIPALGWMKHIPNHVLIIEDCAHALGATWDGCQVGTLTDFGCFSFQAIKFATTIDGGMLVCNRDAPRARRLRWFGIDRNVPRIEADIKEVGYKYHMNNMTAAMGRIQLQSVATVIDKHKANGAYYESELSTIPGVDYTDYDSRSRPSYWLFTLLLDSTRDRDLLSGRLTEAGIGNGVVHKRNDLHTVFKDSACELPGLDKFYSTMLHIPCGWWVTEEDREAIMEVIRAG